MASKTSFLSELITICQMARMCNSCKEWNTIAEEIIQKKKGGLESESAKSKAPKPLKSMK
jgi:predicted ATP-dependent serine protease